MVLVDVDGSAGATELRHSEPKGLNAGVICGVTVISIVVGSSTLACIRSKSISGACSIADSSR